MLWGYALVWMPELLALDDDPLMARLKWLARSGLQTTGIDLDDVECMKRSGIGWGNSWRITIFR
jgi:hypothetical protein